MIDRQVIDRVTRRILDEGGWTMIGADRVWLRDDEDGVYRGFTLSTGVALMPLDSYTRPLPTTDQLAELGATPDDPIFEGRLGGNGRRVLGRLLRRL